MGTPTIGPLTEKDMAGFLLAHAAMRQEFALLAAVAESPHDDDRAALIEDQIDLVCDILHKHHNGEDASIFATLRERKPEIKRDIETLEAEHAQINPVLDAATDKATPLAERARTLKELHTLINAHLDREERVAVPEITTCITRAEWKALADGTLKETPRKRMPLVFGWLASAGSEQLKADALAAVPAIPRTLFRLIWWPAYQRRMVRLYGADTTATVLKAA
jgi:hemerythrin-like domain-containing protein